MKNTTAVLLPLLAAFSALLPSVHAHGYLAKFTVDGKSYNGNTPGGKASDSPIRQISTIDPVKGASNANLKCGQQSQNAALVADANPGSTISFLWGDPNGSGWPHNTGPLMTYMASCGSTTCDKFDASNAQWFKIAEAGKKPGNDSTWVQQDIMNGKSYTTQIPEDLASGGYLIRHEIIALHLAMTEGGAEFYPSCTQVNVGGTKTGTPPKSDLASFPGAYKDTDPGIFDKNIYEPGASYTFPGPPVVNLGSSGSSSGSTDSSPGSTNSSVPVSQPSPDSSDHNSTSSGMTKPTESSLPSSSPTGMSGSNSTSSSSSCSSSSSKKRSLAKRKRADDNHLAGQTRPKHVSRVFGKLNHNSEW
jgi:hypothetical protein